MITINKQQLELLQQLNPDGNKIVDYLKALDEANLGLVGKAQGVVSAAATRAKAAVHAATAPVR